MLCRRFRMQFKNGSFDSHLSYFSVCQKFSKKSAFFQQVEGQFGQYKFCGPKVMLRKLTKCFVYSFPMFWLEKWATENK